MHWLPDDSQEQKKGSLKKMTKSLFDPAVVKQLRHALFLVTKMYHKRRNHAWTSILSKLTPSLEITSVQVFLKAL